MLSPSSAIAAGAALIGTPAIAAAAQTSRIMSHPLVVMTGWSPRSLAVAVWSMTPFPGPHVSSLHHDVERDVEPLMASFQPEAVDVSSPVGLDGQADLGQNHEFYRAGKLEIRRPGRRPALPSGADCIDVQGVVGADVAPSGVAQHDATALEEGRARRDGCGRPEAALDVEHVVHYLRTVGEEGAG